MSENEYALLTLICKCLNFIDELIISVNSKTILFIKDYGNIFCIDYNWILGNINFSKE